MFRNKYKSIQDPESGSNFSASMDLLGSYLRQAGCPDETLAGCLASLQGNGVSSISILREKLRNGEELADLLAPHRGPWKQQFRLLVEKEAGFKHRFLDVDMALRLCEVAYGKYGDDLFKQFTSDFAPLVLDLLMCPITSQLYAVAVLEVKEVLTESSFFSSAKERVSKVLVVAYAGTDKAKDWLTNFNARTTCNADVGGSAHAGFLTRANLVKFPGLKRLQQSYECSRVIITGHSLGGGVAHLTALQAMERNIFGQQAEVLSIAFGAPFCVTESIVTSMKTDEWTSQFLTIVNGDDPVPRILNVVATLQSVKENRPEGLEQFFEKAAELAAVVCGVNVGQKALECGKILKGLLPNLEAFINQHDSTYRPLGVYLLIKGQNGGRVAESIINEECKEKLGGAQFLRNGWVDEEKLVSHSMNGYKKACQASAVRSKFADSGNVQNIPSPETQDLPFKIMGAEFSVWNGASTILNLHLVGQGLDFLGETAVKVQEAGELKWRIHSCAETYVLLQADISSTHCATQLTTLEVSVRPDMQNVHGEDLTITATKSSSSSQELQMDVLVFNENFLATMMKAAWVFKHILQDDTGLVLLDNLDRLAKQHAHQKYVGMSGGQHPRPVYVTEVLTFRKLVNKVSNIRGVQQVGSLENPEVKLHLKHVHQWLCPEEGHTLHTTLQQCGRVLCVVVAAVGVALTGTGAAALAGATTLVANGGAYIGSGLCITGASAAVRSKLCSPLQEKYENMLLHIYNWTRPKSFTSSPSAFGLESALIDRVETLRGDNAVMFPGPWHGAATKASQDLLAELYEGVRCIHNLKKQLSNVSIVAIVGPQKVGKSLLLGQLLMDANLARRESDSERRTEDIPCHKWAPGVLLLDSPGLTSASGQIARMYFQGTNLLTTLHVYFRESAANPENFDVDAVFDMLWKSYLPSPPLLLCLNKLKSTLKDGHGEYPSVEKLQSQKVGFLQKLRSMVKKKARSLGLDGFWQGFDATFAKKWEKVDIVYSDLGLEDMSSAPQPIQDYCRSDVYDARKIAGWLQGAIDPERKNTDLDATVKRVDRVQFQRDYEASRPVEQS